MEYYSILLVRSIKLHTSMIKSKKMKMKMVRLKMVRSFFCNNNCKRKVNRWYFNLLYLNFLTQKMIFDLIDDLCLIFINIRLTDLIKFVLIKKVYFLETETLYSHSLHLFFYPRHYKGAIFTVRLTKSL